MRREKATQNRVIKLFTDSSRPDCLGFEYLGDWSSKSNKNIETELLKKNLKRRGYTDAQISQALLQLETAAETTGTTLYQANLRTYNLLRYPIKVKTAIDKPFEDVNIIDWETIDNNDFGIAQEVTLKGGFERRPDLVLYINGIALAVIELKRSSVEIADGIRQLITNQEPIFNQQFFSTVQLVFAGNDSQGLRYGTTGTPEQFFVAWEDQTKSAIGSTTGELLDKPLAQMCNKATLLELIRNFILFDAGQKKVPRPHQYQGIKAAQARIKTREGGVIWHTQGSGKSILMVLLAKWVMEHDPEARILIVTDRDELDKQIEGVMRNAGVIPETAPSPRITTRANFIEALTAPTPRLLCALVHKFDTTNLEGALPPVSGRFYVFVDECHRTQGGNMNKQMKRWLQNSIFIGFTGTPLLRKDKQTTRDIFGSNIHTYKFHQAVADGVVLDLKYEARTVPQQLTSQTAVDNWFENRTRNLNNYQKSVVRKAWANMEKLMSAGERKQRIIASIIEDFSLKNRLNNHRGTAILVAASIYDACHYYRLFQNTNFGQYCGIVTSYEPNHNAISREPANSDERYKFDTYTQHVLGAGQSTTAYETEIKRQFKDEPTNCKLLIVVSKLLTGFDAPSCSYIYLDNELRDHNLFQAICRTNRLDGDDKDFGYIVDFKELFGDVQDAISVYTSDELDTEESSSGENNVELKNWLVEGKKKLDDAREAIKYLCDPVAHPKEMEQFIAYFCGEANNPEALTETEPLRIAFYQSVVTLVRAFSAISNALTEAGYTDADMIAINYEVENYAEIRASIKKYSGEELDIKPFEADMRHLMNTYIKADSADPLGDIDQYSLVEMIIQTGINDAIAKKLNEKGKLSRNSVAEGIINNIRQTIIRDQLTDPRFYKEMSKLLDDLIQQKRDDTEAYEAFLKMAESLVHQMANGQNTTNIPAKLQGNAEAIIIYNNLQDILSTSPLDNVVSAQHEAYGDALMTLALKIDATMLSDAPAGWRGDDTREKQVLNALFPIMQRDRDRTTALFELLKNMQAYE
jgi:type I restriction enzyme, R subunit